MKPQPSWFKASQRNLKYHLDYVKASGKDVHWALDLVDDGQSDRVLITCSDWFCDADGVEIGWRERLTSGKFVVKDTPEANAAVINSEKLTTQRTAAARTKYEKLCAGLLPDEPILIAVSNTRYGQHVQCHNRMPLRLGIDRRYRQPTIFGHPCGVYSKEFHETGKEISEGANLDRYPGRFGFGSPYASYGSGYDARDW